MPSSGVLTQPVTARVSVTLPAYAENWQDWEAPEGGAAARARIDPLPYVYSGDGDPHWRGQGCDILDLAAAMAGFACEVVFACGCHARVAPSSVRRRRGTT